MQVKFIDWRSDQDIEEDRLALTYHINSNHYPQMDVLTRSRMKMLKNLFAQMNVEVTPAKRYFSSPTYGLHTQELTDHPFIMELLDQFASLQAQAKPFLDFKPMKEFSREQLDGPEMYVLSRNKTSGMYDLFYFSILKLEVERVKEAEPDVWEKLFDPNLVQHVGAGAVFITANIHRSIILFGERGYRLSLLEGGRLTERLSTCLYGKRWDLEPLMTFYDQPAKELLGIDGQYEVALSCLIIREEE
jgi:hypothetical protein